MTNIKIPFTKITVCWGEYPKKKIVKSGGYVKDTSELGYIDERTGEWHGAKELSKAYGSGPGGHKPDWLTLKTKNEWNRWLEHEKHMNDPKPNPFDHGYTFKQKDMSPIDPWSMRNIVEERKYRRHNKK